MHPQPTPAPDDRADQAAALDARARGRRDEAAVAWRAHLRRHPDDWRAALELKADLKATFHYSESDPLFRRAARYLPDDLWFAHYAALFAFHNDDLDALDARGRHLLGRWPANARLRELLGDVARQRRDWDGAERFLADALALDPGSETVPAKLRGVRLYRRVAGTLRDAPATGDEYALALVNLDRNAERRATVEREFATQAPPLFRVSGVLGSALPAPAVLRLTGDPADAAMRGTLGCFLSHASAWEAMLARGLRHCLVIEDDVVPLLDLPPRLGPLNLPPDYDLCFVNDRLQPRPAPDAEDRADRPRAVPLPEAMLGFPPEDNAPGCDGYLLSAAGARKLLDWVARDGFSGDADWRMLAYGMTPEQIAALPRHSHAWGVLDQLRHLVRGPDRLHAYALHPALIRTVPISSDREDENRERPGAA